MDERPLPKPDHLAGPLPHEWRATHAAGIVALVLGALSLIVTLVAQTQLWATPDWRITVPGFALTLAVAVLAMIRKERSSTYWLLGLGLAGSALVLGWVMMLAIILGVMLALILILHSVM